MRLRLYVIALLCFCTNAYAGSLTSSKFLGTWIPANSVILATQTSGDFVQSVAAGNGISTTGASSGENIQHSISVNQDFDFVFTGNIAFTPASTDDFTVNTDADSNASIAGTGNLLLFGATAGTSAAGVVAFGAATSPASQPADVVQMWGLDISAGNRALAIQGEVGGPMLIGSDQIRNLNADGTLTLYSEDAITLWLDSDDDSAGAFSIRKEAGATLFSMQQNGVVRIHLPTGTLPTCDVDAVGNIVLYDKTNTTNFCACVRTAIGVFAYAPWPVTGDCA